MEQSGQRDEENRMGKRGSRRGMSGQWSRMLILLTVGGVLAGLTAADLIHPDQLFSPFENRLLTGKPKFTWQRLFSGEYTSEYENYVTDQFVGRNGWITIKTLTDVALGKQEVGGVYIGTDGSLIEKHAPEQYDAALEEQKISLLKGLAEWQDQREGRFSVMLVPTADTILEDRLPAHAVCYDQEDFLTQVADKLGDNSVINVGEVLRQHKNEYIYYRTDHHWTTLGAYYGYLAWAEHMQVTPVSYEKKVVSANFYGTLYSKTHLPAEPDRIESYEPLWLRRGEKIAVRYDQGETTEDSLYAPSFLQVRNQYGYFLNDNHALIEIRRIRENTEKEAKEKTLFVIRDSYASCFLPFLTEHYDTILVLDLRYYNSRLFPLLESFEEQEDGMDILVLYNVIHFLEEFRYYDKL